MPRYAADRVLLAPLADVWAFLAEPYHLADWFPGVSGVEPDRRGLAPGARWKVIGPNEPSYFRRPQAHRDAADRRGRAARANRVRAHRRPDLGRPDAPSARAGPDRGALVVDGPWLIGLKRSFPRRALDRLHALLRTRRARVTPADLRHCYL